MRVLLPRRGPAASRGLRGAYHAIAEARNLFGRTGFVLPHIGPNGVVDTAQPLGYDKYVRHLHKALVNSGMGQAVAQTFAGQLPRAGAATVTARARVRPEVIAHAARSGAPTGSSPTTARASGTGCGLRWLWVSGLVLDGFWGLRGAPNGDKPKARLPAG